MDKSSVGDGPVGYMGRAYRSRESRQAVWFYAAHLSSYILPLVTFTYLTRVLGPAEWGKLSVFHSFGLYASQIVEYGFNFTASRDVARERSDTVARAATIADVHAAKIMLGCLLIVGAAIVYPFLPRFIRSPLLFGAAIAYALAQGSTLIWYFQGAGRIGELAAVDAASRGAAAIATIVAVRTSDDGWWMIALNALGCLATTVIGLLMIRRDTPLGVSSMRAGARTLRSAFPLFVFRGANSLYSTANGFILGLLASPASVGYYAGAERVYKGFTALLHPLMQLLYARVNHSMGRSQALEGESWHMARRFGAMMVASGAVLGIACSTVAPVAVSALLGPGFEPAVPVLRLFGVVLLLEAAEIALGIQWMLPLGLDRQFTTVSLAAGATNIALAWLLARSHGELGMVLAVLGSHATAVVGCFAYLRWRGLDPFRRSGAK